MSLLYSAICLAICMMAVVRLNSLGKQSAYLKRFVLVMIAVGSFGGVLRPISPELISGLSDTLFAVGIFTSMVARYYRQQWYEDRADADDTLIDRLLDKVR